MSKTQNVNIYSISIEDAETGIVKEVNPFRRKLNAIFNEWMLTSTSHGLPNIFRSTFRSVKIVWTIFFLVALGVCTAMIVENFTDYLSFDVITKFRTIESDRLEFPEVTICNLNPMVTPKANAYIRDYFRLNHNLSVNNFTDIQAYFGENSLTELNWLFYQTLDDSFDPNLRRQFGYSLEEMVITCRFDSIPCNFSEFTSSYDRVFGNCFQFNSFYDMNGQKKNINTLQQIGGLYLELFMGLPDDSFDYLYQRESNGVRIYIDEQNNPLFNDGFHLKSGVLAKMKTHKTQTTHLPRPYSDCIYPEKSQSVLYDEMEKLGSHLRQDCIDLCTQMIIIQHFGCYDLRYPQLFDAPPCLNKTIFYQLINYHVNLENCSNQCFFNCESVDYEVIPSYSDFPSSIFAQNLMLSENLRKISNDNNMTLNHDLLKKSTVAVYIYFPELKITEITEHVSYSVSKLISDIGGTLGLFIGISLLSFVEIIQLVMEFIIITLKYRNQKKKLEMDKDSIKH